MTVVLDTNVVVWAAFWPESEDRRCFVLLTRCKFRMVVTEAIRIEYRALTIHVGRRECPEKDPAAFLDWIERVALLVEPSPLGKRRSRDMKDDLFLSCALTSQAEFIVTKDKDLVVLKKPFATHRVTRNPSCYEVDAQAGSADRDEILLGFEPRRSRHSSPSVFPVN